ncbi:MAG: hypothetical protein GY940_02705, partial [bacterium]|nr:hypothetical protein [bacterium]
MSDLFTNCAKAQGIAAKVDFAIENVYLEFIRPILHNKDFDVVIISLYNDEEPPSECIINRARARWDKRFQVPEERRRLAGVSMTGFIAFEIWCESGKSAVFQDLSENEEFQNILLTAVYETLGITPNNVNVIQAVTELQTFPYEAVNHGELTFWERVASDEMLIINMIYIAMALLVCFLGFLYVRCKWKCGAPVDVAHSKRFLIFALQIWDLSSDALFVRDVFRVYSVKENDLTDNYLVIFCLSMVFLIAPWGTNVFQVLMNISVIHKKVADNPQAKQWLRRKRNVLAWLVALSGGIYPSISLCSSRLFGLGLFDMGLSSNELANFESIKLKYNVLGENIPQLI